MNSLEKALNRIKKDVKKTIENEVSNKIKETMKERIQEDVYDKYEPTQYVRRREDGGLLDDDNIKSKTISIKDNISLEITNETLSDSHLKRLDKVIEYGVGYEWEDSEIYKMQPYPRPFINNTKEQIDNENIHIDTLKKSLKSKGYDIE